MNGTGVMEPAKEKGLECPGCGSRRFEVTHNEPQPDGRIRRRRVCLKCKRKVITFEKISE